MTVWQQSCNLSSAWLRYGCTYAYSVIKATEKKHPTVSRITLSEAMKTRLLVSMTFLNSSITSQYQNYSEEGIKIKVLLQQFSAAHLFFVLDIHKAESCVLAGVHNTICVIKCLSLRVQECIQHQGHSNWVDEKHHIRPGAIILVRQTNKPGHVNQLW